MVRPLLTALCLTIGLAGGVHAQNTIFGPAKKSTLPTAPNPSATPKLKPPLIPNDVTVTVQYPYTQTAVIKVTTDKGTQFTCGLPIGSIVLPNKPATGICQGTVKRTEPLQIMVRYSSMPIASTGSDKIYGAQWQGACAGTTGATCTLPAVIMSGTIISFDQSQPGDPTPKPPPTQY